MRVLVLGGNGFMGSHLCRALVEAGYEVRVFDRPGTIPCLPNQLGVEFVYGDFSQSTSIEKALVGCDAVFHLLSTTLPKTSNENILYDLESNLLDTVRLLESASRQGVRKILFASSGGTVYGTPQGIPIKEDHPTEPLCSYGITKLAIEKYLGLFERMYGLSYCVLRVANPYGEGQSPTGCQGVIPIFSSKAMRGELITIWGDGSIVRDYIYISDVISAFMKALTYEGHHRVFNIGSGRGHSIDEVLNVIEMLGGKSLNRNYTGTRTFDVPVNVLDIARACKHLKWEPVVPLLDGVTRTMHWLNDEIERAK